MNTYLIMGAVFIAVFSTVLFFLIPAMRKSDPRKNLSRLEGYNTLRSQGLQDSSSSNSFVTVFKKVLAGMRRILPKNLVESVRGRLELAGIQDVLRVDVFLAIKFFFPFIFLFLLVFLMLFFEIPPILRIILVVIIPITYIIPDYYLKGRTAKRQDEVRRSLPNALDLLTISVEAGLGFDQALFKVSDNIKGALGDEFKRTLRELEIGIARKQALQNLSRRTDVTELKLFYFQLYRPIFLVSLSARC